MNGGPALVSIMRQGQTLIASVHAALDDSQLARFEHDLIEQIGRHRSRGVVIDVAALDVIDSFAAHTLRRVADMARLHGARTVIVGIQPEVAFTMVRLGMGTGDVPTALDLEEGLAMLTGGLSGVTGGAHRRAGLRAGRREAHVSEARTVLDDLTQDYRTTLLRFLPRRDEVVREAAYALGRRAVVTGVNLLDMCRLHHEVFLEVLRDTEPDAHLAVAESASELLLEALAAYDMTHRGAVDR